MDVDERLAKLLASDRECRRQEQALLDDSDPQVLTQVLRKATDEAQATEEGLLDLPRLVGLWGQIGTQEAVSALFDLLLSDDNNAQNVACDELVSIADENFKLFGFEAAKRLAEPGPFGEGIEGLAIILSECRDERSIEVMLTMLAHKDAMVTLAALEVAGEWGWEGAVQKAIARLRDDPRQVTVHDEDEGPVEMSLGELATQVHDSLRLAFKGQKQ